MAKVLVSLLGTGKKASGDETENEYLKTDYLLDGINYENETMIAYSLIEHYGINKLFLLGTKTSMWDNIAESFADEEEYLAVLEAKEAGRIDEGSLTSLNQAIDNKLKCQGSKCLLVDEGENEEELWANFEKFLEIMGYLDDGDELYLDITHLFRSLSIMSFVMSDFIKNYKEIRLAGVFYGMLKKGEPSLIINITLFFDLLAWAKAIKTLKDSGDGSALSKLINSKIDDRALQNSFKDFSHALSISDLSAIQMSIKNLKGKMQLFEQYDNKIVNLIGKDLREFINELDVEPLSKFQFKLARWYAGNNNYAMAYISLTEGAISAVCERYGLEVSLEGNKEAKKILREYGNWKTSSDEKQAIAKAYQKANSIRNNIAHKLSSDNKSSKSSPVNSIENFELYYGKLVNI